MGQPDLKDVFQTLFTAPVHASLQAEQGYRAIWGAWIRQMQTVVASVPDAAAKRRIIDSYLDLAPVMQFSADIEAEITMRLESATATSGSASLSLGVGPVSIGGGFSHSKSSTSESSLTARASYKVVNGKSLTLRDFLANAGKPVTTDAELTAAADLVEKGVPAGLIEAVRGAPALPAPSGG